MLLPIAFAAVLIYVAVRQRSAANANEMESEHENEGGGECFLLGLPGEILERVLGYLEPEGLVAASQVSSPSSISCPISPMWLLRCWHVGCPSRLSLNDCTPIVSTQRPPSPNTIAKAYVMWPHWTITTLTLDMSSSARSGQVAPPDVQLHPRHAGVHRRREPDATPTMACRRGQARRIAVHGRAAGDDPNRRARPVARTTAKDHDGRQRPQCS